MISSAGRQIFQTTATPEIIYSRSQLQSTAENIVNKAITSTAESNQSLYGNFQKIFDWIIKGYFKPNEELKGPNQILALEKKSSVEVIVGGAGGPFAQYAIQHYIGTGYNCKEPTENQWQTMAKAIENLNNQLKELSLPIKFLMDRTSRNLSEYLMPKTLDEIQFLPKIQLINCESIGAEPLDFKNEHYVFSSAGLQDQAVAPDWTKFLPFEMILMPEGVENTAAKNFQQLLQAVTQVNRGRISDDGAFDKPNSLKIYEAVGRAICQGIKDVNGNMELLSPSANADVCEAYGLNADNLRGYDRLGPLEKDQFAYLLKQNFNLPINQTVLDQAVNDVYEILVQSAQELEAKAAASLAGPASAPSVSPPLASGFSPGAPNQTSATASAQTVVTQPISENVPAQSPGTWNAQRVLSGFVSNLATQLIELPLRKWISTTTPGNTKTRQAALAAVATLSQMTQLAIIYGMAPERLPSSALQLGLPLGLGAVANLGAGGQTLRSIVNAMGVVNQVVMVSQMIKHQNLEALQHIMGGLAGKQLGTAMAEFGMRLAAQHPAAKESTYNQGFYKQATEGQPLTAAAHWTGRAMNAVQSLGRCASSIDRRVGNVLMDYLGGRKMAQAINGAEMGRPSLASQEGWGDVELGSNPIGGMVH